MVKKGKGKHWKGDFTNKNNKRLQELLQALDAERTRFELVEP